MKCEEFEAIGLDAERDASLSEVERAAAREHASKCSRCAALQDSWQAAHVELRALAEATRSAETPPRVEMRLRQEFRAQYRTSKARRAGLIAAWTLAAAAVLVGVVSWRNWRKSQKEEAAMHLNAPQGVSAHPVRDDGGAAKKELLALEATNPREQNPVANGESGTLLAGNDLNDFTLLPGVLPLDTDDTAILRVRMQRGALGALGLPVNEERAGEWIQVDLLVGNDGLPQAVRLSR